jgi:hypothetical protein
MHEPECHDMWACKEATLFYIRQFKPPNCIMSINLHILMSSTPCN